MNVAVLATVGEGEDKLIFLSSQVAQVLKFDAPDIQLSTQNDKVCVYINGDSFEIINPDAISNTFEFYLILSSHCALAIEDYTLLFRVHVLPNGYARGIDVSGYEHKGRLFDSDGLRDSTSYGRGEALSADSEVVSLKDLTSLKEVARRLKQGEFYEALTEEISEKVKEIAEEMIACRRDLQKRIEPSIVGLAVKEIPETSNELEGINETLEKSTMKIMDINEDILAQCTARLEEFQRLASTISVNDKDVPVDREVEDEKIRAIVQVLSSDFAMLSETIKKHVNTFEKIKKLSMNMTEPLCFQDLVGQRIQRIVELVKSMEQRVQSLVISLGVKLQRYKDDPFMGQEQSTEKMNRGSLLLKGPQREGEGLDQNAVDDLLASL